MAKLLTRQPRIFDTQSTVFVADGLPLHSALFRDMPAWINNMSTYQEPTFQFLYDASFPGGSEITWTKLSGESGNGSIFMGQFPIILPHDAKYLCWTLGFYRNAFPLENGVNMDVGYIHMYLCPEPLRDLQLGAGNDTKRFDPTKLKWYDVRSNFVNITASTVGRSYTLMDDSSPGWEGFMTNVPVRPVGGDPAIVYAVIVAEVSSATNGEILQLAELSIWGAYE